MRKFIISVTLLLVIPAAVYAGLNFGLIKATKKVVAKVDEKVALRKAALVLDSQAPTVPTSLTAVAVSSSQINLAWTASTDNVGVTGYKIYRDGGGTPITTAAGTAYNNTGLTGSTGYSYTVSACDAAGNCSAQTSASSDTTHPGAGGEWVLVPGSATLGTSDFYVMKYEAKNVGGVATSQAALTPWINISHEASTGACVALGAGYHLVTIAEAQTINRNIEAQAANWADGTIGSLIAGSGGLKRGNVGVVDSASYNLGALDSGTGRDEKAKHVLSNGGEIWDWSGNVSEWIYGAGANGTQGTPGGVAFNTGGYYEWNSGAPDLSQERPILGPSNSSWIGTHGMGSYAAGTADKAINRGGSYVHVADAGMYYYNSFSGPTATGGAYGFRCATPDSLAPTVPASLTAVAVSSSQINLSWAPSSDNTGVTAYKVYRNGGASPLVTQAGTTYSNTGLTELTVSTYTVSACDAAGNCSVQSSTASALTSPGAGGEWVLVPGSATLGTSDFYVMKYEVKGVGSVATSQAAAAPWVTITLANSIVACSALGSGYHLLTIAEAQTISRNIEAQTANWANGSVGSLVAAGGGLKRGNVGLLDSAGYDGANPESGTGRDEKAKLVLSNAAELWDWSGNVAEWIYGAGAGGTQGTPGGVTFDVNGFYDWDRTAAPNLSQERPILGPSNSGYTSANGVGQYYGGATTDAAYRDGYWADGVSAGVFAYMSANATSYAPSFIGFRCGAR
ncbi:MAG TPA: hypothetical protein DCL44_08015 [Elusimicrobia bacterium]|nr:hypothetical protein [Elusimicrobiota bacterium]